MYINAYEFEVENMDGKSIPVALRLGIGAQIQLKKKWKENTTSTLFGAVDDIERFIDVMDAALKWKGNSNEIKSGEELIDLMAANDMLGMVAKQELLTSIGRTSGLFSDEEKAKIDARAKKAIDGIFDEDEVEGDEEAKNA